MMNAATSTLLAVIVSCAPGFGQDPDALDLARLLAHPDTQQAAIRRAISSGDKLQVLLSLAKAPPAQLDDLELTVLNDGLADIFGILKAEDAIPFLVRNMGNQRFPPVGGVIWSKPLDLIKERLPALAALINIGPAAANAIMRASPWDMGPEQRLAAIIGVSEIAYQMKDPHEERTFLRGMLAQANQERIWAQEGLKHLERPNAYGMRLGLYVIKDRIIIPTLAETPAGFREIEPVVSFTVTDPELSLALEAAVRRGNPLGDAPSRLNFPEPVVLKYAGVKSWGAFVAIAEHWDLVADNGTYTLSRSTRDSKGNYWGGKEKLLIPSDATGTLPDTKAIIDAILSDTKGTVR
jgi:hypothetical protein